MTYFLTSGARVRCRSNRAYVLIIETAVRAWVEKRTDSMDALEAAHRAAVRRYGLNGVRYYLGYAATGAARAI